MPGDAPHVDGSAELAPNVRRDRALMPGLADHDAPPPKIRLPSKRRHVLRPKPPRVAVKLVLAKRMAGDEMDLMALAAQAEGGLAR